MNTKKIGVVGAGTMGIGVSADLLLHEYIVVLVDISHDIIETAKKNVYNIIRTAPLMAAEFRNIDSAQYMQNIKLSLSLDDVKDCDFIIENIPEKLDQKKEIYKALDEICPQNICIAANTSCIPITQLASFAKRKDRILGIHFMNPSYLKKTVEVIYGFHTSKDTMQIAELLLNKLNKKSIVVEDSPGFVANRISHLYMNEAAFIVHEKVASPNQIDDIFVQCYGHKMGPLQTADIIGLDTVVNSLDILYSNYQDVKFRCCPLLRKMVSAGLLGKKTGQGFYTYNE